MVRRRFLGFYLLVIFIVTPVWAQTPAATDQLEDLKTQIETLKKDYELRIKSLEDQLQQLQIQILQAAPEAPAEPVASTPVQSSPALLNPAISVIGNFVSRTDDQDVFNEEGDAIDDKMNLREAELDFRAAIDPYADGVLIASIESEFPGEFATGVEEGYAIIKKLPFLAQTPLGLRLKVGRFRPSFGRLNILHTHDLPTSFRPLPIEDFLGEEGFIGNGVSGTFYLPTPWDPESSLDATIEVIDGGNIGISPDPAARIAYLGHLRWFRTFSDAHNVELGLSSYFHPSGNGLNSANVNGLDFLYKWKPLRYGEWNSYLIGAEYMFAPDTNLPLEEPALAKLDSLNSSATPKGFTVFSQWQFDRRTYAGLRYDRTEALFDPDLKRQSVTPYLSYYFSEFLRFRVNYEHRWSDLIEEDGRNSLFFELNWIIGAHPPEPFWVNK